MTREKLCQRCGEIKPISEFYRNKARPDGLSGFCVSCQKLAAAESRWKRRLAALAALGGKCRRCSFGDARALQVDHVQGGGRQERLELSNVLALYRDIQANPAKYQLLCANCNAIKRIEEQEHVGARVYVRVLPVERRDTSRAKSWTTERKSIQSDKVKEWFRDNPEAVAERNRKISETRKAKGLGVGQRIKS